MPDIFLTLLVHLSPCTLSGKDVPERVLDDDHNARCEPTMLAARFDTQDEMIRVFAPVTVRALSSMTAKNEGLDAMVPVSI